MPGVIAPFNWNYPLIGESAHAPNGFQMLGEDVAATLTDTTVQPYTPTWTASGAQPGALGAVQGRYRVDHGICYFSAYLGFGAGTSGGTGTLAVGLPKAARADVQSQLVDCWLHVPAYAHFFGTGNIGASATTVQPFLGVGGTNTGYQQWINADSNNTPGTGSPNVPSNWNVLTGGWFVMSGRYFCVP